MRSYYARQIPRVFFFRLDLNKAGGSGDGRQKTAGGLVHPALTLFRLLNPGFPGQDRDAGPALVLLDIAADGEGELERAPAAGTRFRVEQIVGWQVSADFHGQNLSETSLRFYTAYRSVLGNLFSRLRDFVLDFCRWWP